MDDTSFDMAAEARLYFAGIEQFNRGEFFEAHDTWEEVWRQTPDRRRERFYRALIQSAVTLELLRRGRAVGVRQVFASCAGLFEKLPETFMGLHVPTHLDRLRHAIEPVIKDLETRHVRIDPSRLFRITLLYDPFGQPRNGENTVAPTSP